MAECVMQTSHARRVDATLARGSRQQFVERADCGNSRLGRQRRGVQQRPFGESGKRVCSGTKRSRQLVGTYALIVLGLSSSPIDRHGFGSRWGRHALWYYPIEGVIPRVA